MAPGRRNVRGAEAVDQGSHEIAEGGQHLWGVPGAQAGAVFLEADIAHIMATVFDAPMPAIEVQQALWTGLEGREGGDEIDHLSGGFARSGHGTGQLSDSRDERSAGSKVGIHLGTDLDSAYLNASSSAIDGLRLPVAGLWIGKIGR